MERILQRRLEMLAVAVLFTAWGGLGQVLDRRGYTDALYWPDYVVHEVAPGSVLDESGFQVGDRFQTVEGFPVETLGMYSRWPRALSRRPGETLAVTVERDGRSVPLIVRYRETPESVESTRRVALVVVLSFLWLGMAVLFTSPTPHAFRFALVGLAAGATLAGPDLGVLNGVLGHVQVAAEVLWVILLLHFFLLFPTPKGVARSRWVGLLYAPWLVLVVCLALEVVTHPRLYHAFGAFIGILLVGYLLTSVGVVIHTVATTGWDHLTRTGMGIILVGWGVAVIPNAVAVVGWLIPPGLDTPGQAFFPYLLTAIPLTMALAVRTEASRDVAGAGG